LKAIITGGSGFIGTSLAKHLSVLGWPFKILDFNISKKYFDLELSNYDVVYADVRDQGLMNSLISNVDVVFHLAGLVGTDYLVNHPKDAVETNIIGTINILDAIRGSNTSVIYLSLIPEWNSPYMITKHAAEKFCNLYHEEFNTQTTIIQATHIYGERQKWKPARKAVPNFILSALQNKPINIFGTGKQLMDLIYIEDAVKSITQISKCPNMNGKTIEMGSGKGVNVIALAKLIIEMTSSSSEIKFLRRRGGEPLSEHLFSPANTTKLSNIVDMSSLMGLEQGLDRTIKWYRSQLEKGIINYQGS
jgi:UDP-glucose 4-epimerase